ncbi:MAG: sigma 54-interacting transcriptional regulator, partial [Myxococcales bacterium]|nr:sigma 54-interacting transcriptional regulator [Myxococcales bacterium]
FERRGGLELEGIALAGEPLATDRERLLRDAGEVLEAGLPRLVARQEASAQRVSGPRGSSPGRAAILPIRTERRELVLVLVRTRPGGALSEQDVERLAVFASLASASLERARDAEALRRAAARDAATIEAIRDGVLTLDADGGIRAMNEAAARLLRLERRDALGRQLGRLAGLAPLAAALGETGALDNEVVTLPHSELLVRSRSYEGGLVATFQERSSAQRLAQKLMGSDARFTFDDLIGRAPSFIERLDDARRAATSDVPILITGESGTGKELLAQAIHNASTRASAPFVGINVAAIPRELLESELFGYERGAFTGARVGGHAGKFELAEAGTLLLDEIGEMSYEMQAKLLRVLQERIVLRLGGSRSIHVKARIIATTHRDLEEAVRDGSFRLDLYYRLRVVHLRLPSLRERREDIPRLIDHYLARYAERTGRPEIRVSPAVMRQLEDYDWPGNIRELANLIEGEASLLPASETELNRRPRAMERARRPSSAVPVPAEAPWSPGTGPDVLPLAEVERRIFQHALDRYRGNVAKAARALGVARGTFYNKMRRYELGE